MTDILTITDRAADRISKIISEAQEDIIGVKVGVDKTGCSGYAYKLDYAKEVKGCDVVETKGIKVFIEPTAVMFLIGSQMDYSTDKLSSRFTFNNPNEKSTCGCGESFNI
jgi:iron-sulfur cluster assembly protein|tara:strand:- start:89 stop:418 length:330 start_codon:yes stop_codon:yes gene_type:complete